MDNFDENSYGRLRGAKSALRILALEFPSGTESKEATKLAVPEFQAFLLPVLRLAADNREHTVPEVRDLIADEFNLSQEDRSELIPSGIRTRLHDRVSWSKTYLQAAGLVETPARARFRITAEGHRVLDKNPGRIDTALLRQYESFRQFYRPDASRPKVSGSAVQTAPSRPDALTPSEAMEAAYVQHRAGLIQEILTQVKAMSPAFFERAVVDLMIRLGYGGTEGRGNRLGRSGDGGVDGVIYEDKLGLELVYVQAKRWEGVVGRPAVQAFVGSLEGFRSRKGVMITTSKFTADATAYVENIEKRVVLIDGFMLASLMIDTGLGITPDKSYTVSSIDSDFFTEE